MNVQVILDAVNAAKARVDTISAQIEGYIAGSENDKALALEPQLDAANSEYKKMNDLYVKMLNANKPGADPVQRLQPADAVQVSTDEGDQPFVDQGEFLKAVMVVARYPGREDPRLQPLKYKDATGLSEGVPADGGYLLSPAYNGNLIERMYQDGNILSRISIDPIGPNANSALYNGIDESSRVAGSRWGGVLGYWVAESGSITKSKPTFRQFEVKPKKVAALCYATDEQLQDTVNLSAWMSRVVPAELRFQAEDAIYEGDGVGKPLGIMNSPCLISQLRYATSTISYVDIVNMWARRWAGVAGYVWLINQDVMPQLDAMVISSTVPVPPNFFSYGADGGLRMKGIPVLEVEYAQTMGTVGDILLCNLAQYQAAIKGDLQSASSIHVQFLTDETCFRFTWRIDGQPSWHKALTPLHGSNTQSPFVALAAATA
jgi:HK97 family phage major capsid protein